MLKPFMRSKEWSEGDIHSVMNGMTSYLKKYQKETTKEKKD